MHELALSRSIVEAAERHAGGARVVRVDVTVGALRQVVPGSLAFCFGIVSRGTPCEGARLHQRPVPARLRCACDHEWTLAELSFRCPRCGGADAEVIDGDQLRVESIEVAADDEPRGRGADEHGPQERETDEVEEAGCTAPR